MKKLLLLFSVVALLACKEKKDGGYHQPTFKEIATKELYATIDRRLPHDAVDAPKIYNTKDIIVHDSAYACVFDMNFKNQFGGWSRGGFTFVCAQVPGGKKVYLSDGKDENLLYTITEKYSTEYERALIYCEGILTRDYVEFVSW